MMKKTRKMVLLSIFIAQALVLSIIEGWIPVPVGIPGVKLGLANIITIITIVFLGARTAFLLVIIRVTLSSMFSGGLVVFLFSLSGGLLSCTVMVLAYYKLRSRLSILGISVLGSVAHNVGQLLAASVIMQGFSVMAYLPVLLLSGVIMGVFVGLTSNFLIEALNKAKISKKFN